MVGATVNGLCDAECGVPCVQDVELDFMEFKECLCRAADMINPEEFLRLSIKVEQLMAMTATLALQSGEHEHDGDYAQFEGEVKDEGGEEGRRGGGGGDGSSGEREGDKGEQFEGTGSLRDLGAALSESDGSSSDDDFDHEVAPACLQSASIKYIVDE